jgi:glutamate dehydrogenase (NAD(P)+)
VTRRYALEVSPFLGPETDIPAPDVNTNGQLMAWLMDTLSMIRGSATPYVVTGSPGVSEGHEGTPALPHRA